MVSRYIGSQLDLLISTGLLKTRYRPKEIELLLAARQEHNGVD